jgi:macrolide transport system ATP-binding/permease protein
LHFDFDKFGKYRKKCYNTPFFQKRHFKAYCTQGFRCFLQGDTVAMARFLRFERVSFAYQGMKNMLITNLDAHIATGWTGIVGPNGAGKTTFLQLAAGDLEPSDGFIHHLSTSRYAMQRTDSPPEGMEDFQEAKDLSAIELKQKLAIRDDWFERWDTLSHGERKRMQIAVVLWDNPEVLALDEPTNHIDAEARNMLIDALKDFKGVGLLVSHDRELLDSLCNQCVFINPPNAVVRPGGVTAGMEQDRREQMEARSQDESVKKAAKRLKRAAQNQLEQAEQASAKGKNRKFKKLDKRDHDGRERRNLAKMTGRNARGGSSQSASLSKRAAELENSRSSFNIRKEYEMGFWLEESRSAMRSTVLSVSSGELSLGGDVKLAYPDLYVSPTDRIAITGANGLGKSTLLKLLLGKVSVNHERLISIPQEITADEAKNILDEVKSLPKNELGQVMTCVSRLGSRPGTLLESEQPSPGEIRKLLLALGVTRGPHLIVMDEPTNHMDLPSIECLEGALSACPCALILVSHDMRFLESLTDHTWHLASESPNQVRLVPGRRDSVQDLDFEGFVLE